MRALPLLLALIAPSIALAESVTYHLTGTVDFVDNGSSGTLDLSGTFAPGQVFTLDLPANRSTAATSHPDQWTWIWSNLGTNAHFTIGSYACTGSAASAVILENDYFTFDEIDFIMYTLSAPAVASASPAVLQVTFQDNAAAALTSGILPRPFPDVSLWSSKSFMLSFSNGVTTGTVAGTFTGTTTPAFGTSWGALKNLYRQ